VAWEFPPPLDLEERTESPVDGGAQQLEQGGEGKYPLVDHEPRGTLPSLARPLKLL
jgi:hypothetical protein